jgi:hypothetical protein
MNRPFKGEVKTPVQALMKYGLNASGFASEAKKLLAEVCVWDYMGSSEYEWGEIPKALRGMLLQKDLKAFWINCKFSHSPWGNKPIVSGTRTVFVIATEENADEAVKRICDMALGNEHCKERTEFSASLAEHEFSKNTVGWFDLDNLFMFFKDEDMFNDWCVLFACCSAIFQHNL